MLASGLSTFCQVKLPRLISDGMVLQRNREVKIWGWASVNEPVKLFFNQKVYSTKADKTGKWDIMLPAQQAGGPYNMIIEGSNRVQINDILFGDVWLCSGQSNMELTMQRVKDKYADLISKADNSMIRQFTVPDKYNFNQPEKDLESGRWQAVNARNIFEFSAVAYFFATELFSKYKVPVGLINSALGGSPVEAWLSEDALKHFPSYYAEAKKFRQQQLIAQIENTNTVLSNTWYNRLNLQDEGRENHWSGSAFNDSRWQQMLLPGYWADHTLGPVNGAVWFRKDIDVPHSMVGKPAKLLLGRIVDADSVFINGQLAGTTGYQYPPRRYELPATLLKEGRNNITVRVINSSGKGGFVPDKVYALIAGKDTLDLKGAWKYRLGASMDPLPAPTFVRWKPMGLFNAMIAPLLNYPVKGVIWYQGEANTDQANEYTGLFKALITDWRAKWKQAHLPFLFVQLANFMEPATHPTESNWAALRQAQFNILSQVPQTGMAVTIDLGEWNDIHPLNKLDVGKRLALQAMRLAYHDNKVIASGPLYKSMQITGKKIILNFTNEGDSLVPMKGKQLAYFSVAGADNRFVWANAVITGKNQVTVWNDNLAHPVAVRYAWADNPVGANLYNAKGLPASPFEAGSVSGKK